MLNPERFRLKYFTDLQKIFLLKLLMTKNKQHYFQHLPMKKMLKSLKKNKTELSIIVAEKLAKKAHQKKITKIFFDRGIYKYHGRVKIFAETLRKNGMEF